MSVRILQGDCREVLRGLDGERFHVCITDPPYHLTSIVKRFGAENAAPAKSNGTGVYARSSAGFMGQQWDGGDVAFQVETWRAVYNVLLPGAHLAAFGGTRGWHRLACAIEDAGFEIRDTMAWIYGSGFAKSWNVDTHMGADVRCLCHITSVEYHSENHTDIRSEVRGLRSDVPQEHEASIEGQDTSLLLSVQRSPAGGGLGEARLQREFGAHARVVCESSDEGGKKPSMEGRSDIPQEARELCQREVCSLPTGVSQHGADGRLRNGTSASDGAVGRPTIGASGMRASSRSQSTKQRTSKSRTVAMQSEPQVGGAWPLCERCGKPRLPTGLGTALKPAFEPIILARKPLIGTVAQNVLAHGTGAINVDGCRVEATNRPARGNHNDRPSDSATSYDMGSGYAIGTTDLGRWPANVLHDGSPEVLAAFPKTQSVGHDPAKSKGQPFGGTNDTNRAERHWMDKGSAARFFASFPMDDGCFFTPEESALLAQGSGIGGGADLSGSRFHFSAKADSSDRAGSKHPTVKPTDLMRWLVRLLTPPGGTVLDPFAGTGSTGLAADQLGFDAVLIEQSAEYADDARRKITQDAGLFATVLAEPSDAA